MCCLSFQGTMQLMSMNMLPFLLLLLASGQGIQRHFTPMLARLPCPDPFDPNKQIGDCQGLAQDTRIIQTQPRSVRLTSPKPEAMEGMANDPVEVECCPVAEVTGGLVGPLVKPSAMNFPAAAANLGPRCWMVTSWLVAVAMPDKLSTCKHASFNEPGQMSRQHYLIPQMTLVMPVS